MSDPLANIRGLGPAKRQALLDRFGSVEAILTADEQSLCSVEGIGPALAQAIVAVRRPSRRRPVPDAAPAIRDPSDVRDRLLDIERAREVAFEDPIVALARSMPTDGAAITATMPSLGRDILDAGIRWVKRDLLRALIFGVVAFVVGFFVNTYVMARLYDGFNVPSGAGATGRGNTFWGGLIWLLASAIVGTLASYRLSVGHERFWRDVRTFPSTMKEMVARDGDRALVHLLWGFAGATVAVLVLAPTFSGLFAVGMLVMLGSALRPLVTGPVLAIWKAVGRRFFPDRPVQPAIASLVVASLGSTTAFAAGYVVQGTGTRLVLGGAAAGGAYFLTHRSSTPAPGGGAAVVIGVALAAAWLVTPEPAAADDGGWAECGSSLARWLECGGSIEVWLRGVLGGFFSFLGGVFGGMFGGGAASDGAKKFGEMSPSERRRFLQDYLVDKGMTPEQAAAAARQIVDGEGTYAGDLNVLLGDLKDDAGRGLDWLQKEAAFLASPEFRDAFAKEYWEDLVSGRQLDRIAMTMEAYLKAPAGVVGGMWEAGGALWEHKEELAGAAMQWIATADTADILAALESAPGKFTDAMINDYKDKLSQIYEASLAGDDKKVADLIGTMAGEEAFGELLGAGMGKALKGGGAMLAGLKKGEAPDIDFPGGKPKDRGGSGPDDPDGGGGAGPFDEDGKPKGKGGADEPDWSKEDPYARPRMTIAEIEQKYKNLQPGERLKLTPEEAAAWGGYEKQMLVEMRANSLQHGTGTGVDEKPWVELKRGNEDALRLREEGYYDGLQKHDYNLKPNHIKSKSLMAEELRYMPRSMDDVKPGEVVSYKPTHIPKEGEVPDEVRQRLLDRQAEWDKLQAGKQPTAGAGPVIDRYGKQVAGEAQLQPDGRWYTRQQVPDAQGRRPYDAGYQDTWSNWSRTAGDNDTFAMGSGSQLMPGIDANKALDVTYTLPDGTKKQGWQMTEQERLQYAASGGSVPGEGNTPFNWTPASPDFNQAVFDQTMQKAANEGVLLVDADGYFLTAPGAHYPK